MRNCQWGGKGRSPSYQFLLVVLMQCSFAFSIKDTFCQLVGFALLFWFGKRQKLTKQKKTQEPKSERFQLSLSRDPVRPRYDFLTTSIEWCGFLYIKMRLLFITIRSFTCRHPRQIMATLVTSCFKFISETSSLHRPPAIPSHPPLSFLLSCFFFHLFCVLFACLSSFL